MKSSQANCQAEVENTSPVEKNSSPSSQKNWDGICCRSANCSHFPALISPVAAQAGELALHVVRTFSFVWVLGSPLTWHFTTNSKHIYPEHWETGGWKAIPGAELTEVDVLIIYGLISLIIVSPGHYKNITSFQTDRYFYKVFVHWPFNTQLTVKSAPMEENGSLSHYKKKKKNWHGITTLHRD